MSHDRASEYWHGGQSHLHDPINCPECYMEDVAKNSSNTKYYGTERLAMLEKDTIERKPGKFTGPKTRRIQHGQDPVTYDPFGIKNATKLQKTPILQTLDDDFGFSAVSAEDVVAVVEANPKNVKMSMIKIFDKINPLLRKLEDNPDKDYIHWPNRQERIRQFREDLQTLIKEEAMKYGKE